MGDRAIKPLKAWAIVDETGEVQLSKLRTTRQAAEDTMRGWQYQSRRHWVIAVEIRPVEPARPAQEPQP